MSKLRRNAQIIYIVIVIIVIASTLWALYDGGYHIAGGLIAGIALGSIITSFLPFFTSMYLLKKCENEVTARLQLKISALILFSLCFPVKLWIIYSNIDLLINGGAGWAFG
ncbi:MAG: hypothetical protein ACI865_001775 [Flavobacteriaceae bacterium]|jgi:hypothetical protein